jgi:hypothetical protein
MKMEPGVRNVSFVNQKNQVKGYVFKEEKLLIKRIEQLEKEKYGH